MKTSYRYTTTFFFLLNLALLLATFSSLGLTSAAAALPEPAAAQTPKLAGSSRISITGTWLNALNTIGGTPTCLAYNSSETEVRYGIDDGITLPLFGTDEATLCAVSPFAEQSGLGFYGRSNVELSCDEIYDLGSFSHYNNPIFLKTISHKMAQAQLNIAIRGDVSIDIPINITFDETVNSSLPCPYGGDSHPGGCFDRVTFDVEPQVFTIGSEICQIQITGFGACNNGGQIAPSGNFITIEGQTNETCFWARTTKIGEVGTIPPPSSCELGPATYYNGFFLRDVDLLNTYVQGRLAAGQNLTLTNFDAGGSLTSAPPASVLTAGKDLSYSGGTVSHGDAIYASVVSQNNVSFNDGGSFRQDSLFDWNMAETMLKQFSADWAALPTNGLTSTSGATLSLTGNDTGTNIFFVTRDQFNDAETIAIDSPAGAIAIVNVSGSGISIANKTVTLSGGIGQQYMRFNFFEASNVSINGGTFRGSILAPLADVQFTSGRLNGTLAAKSVDGSGQLHHFPPLGCPTGVSTSDAYDFGDAPASYGEAGQINDQRTFLGSLIDSESAPLYSPQADGDDNGGQDDEDGVMFAGGSSANRASIKQISVTATNEIHANDFIRGWIDFDGSGTFEAREEVIQQEVLNAPGAQTFSFDVPIPADAACGLTFARFRLVGSLAGPGPTGRGDAGEVEDYSFTINCPEPTVKPPVSCPAGTNLLGFFEDSVIGQVSHEYAFNLLNPGEIQVVGYAKEGNPDSGCSLTGDPSEPAFCQGPENGEGFDLFYLLHGTTELKIGEYRDKLGSGGWQNFYTAVGPFTANGTAGTNAFRVRHATGGNDDIHYGLAFCSTETSGSPARDIAITIAGPAFSAPTQRIDWTIDVSNLSLSDPSQNVRFEGNVSPEINLDGLSSTRPQDWSCSIGSSSFTCTANIPLMPGYTATFYTGGEVPADFPQTEVRHTVEIFSTPADEPENLSNNIDEALTWVAQADAAIDITADKDPVRLEETLIWTTSVSNNSAVPAYQNDGIDAQVRVNIPGDVIYENHSAFNGWACSYNAVSRSAVCERGRIPYGTVNQDIIAIHVRIPADYMQNSVTADASVTTGSFDPNLSNNQDSVTSAVDRSWTLPDPIETSIRPYTHIKFGHDLFPPGSDTMNQERDFDQAAWIRNPLQVPLLASFGITLTREPTLTVIYCTEPGNTGSCADPEATITGTVILRSFTVDSLHHTLRTGGTITTTGANLIAAPVTVPLGIDANPANRTGRTIVPDVDACQALGNGATFEASIDCLAPFEYLKGIFSENDSRYKQTFQWQPYEYIYLHLLTLGGEPVTGPQDPDPNRNPAEKFIIGNAKPGLYKLGGQLAITLRFENTKLGSSVVFIDLPPFPVAAHFQIVAPFQEQNIR